MLFTYAYWYMPPELKKDFKSIEDFRNKYIQNTISDSVSNWFESFKENWN